MPSARLRLRTRLPTKFTISISSPVPHRSSIVVGVAFDDDEVVFDGDAARVDVELCEQRGWSAAPAARCGSPLSESSNATPRVGGEAERCRAARRSCARRSSSQVRRQRRRSAPARVQRTARSRAVVLDHQLERMLRAASSRAAARRAARAARRRRPAGASPAAASDPRRGCRWRRTPAIGRGVARRATCSTVHVRGSSDGTSARWARSVMIVGTPAARRAQPGPGDLARGRPAQVERDVAGRDVLGELVVVAR